MTPTSRLSSRVAAAAIALEQGHQERSERYLAGDRQVRFASGMYPVTLTGVRSR
ncbi:MAG: hypothetical protein PVI30_05210 [Myxococcales bacterium]